MGADFNAGSIEGTLDLNNAPFRAGLEQAKADAKRFEREKVAPRLSLDRTEFDADRARTSAELAALGARTARPEVRVRGTAEALVQLGLVRRMLDSLGKSKLANLGTPVGGVLAKTGGGVGSIAKLMLMPAALLSVAAAAGPATAALLGFGSAAAVAFGGVALSLGLFAGLVKSDMGKIAAANKAGLTLSGPAGEAQKALKRIGVSWDELRKKTAAPVFKVVADTLNGVSKILPKFIPLMTTVAHGFDGVVKSIFKLTSSPVFDQFLKTLQRFMGGFLRGLGPLLATLLGTFMHLFIALQPIMSMLGKGLLAGARAADHFAKSLQNGGLRPFIKDMKDNLPKLGALLSGVFGALANIGRALLPLSGPAIDFITALVTGLSKINIGPVAAGLGKILDAATPLLPVLSSLIDTVLTPFGKLLGDIAGTAITPFATGLSQVLQPALDALNSILSTLEPPLAAFIASIANLANPTGVAAIATALAAINAIIKPLAKPVGDLAVALEGLVDDALAILTPALAAATPFLGSMASGLGKISSGLAAVLKHKAAADTILALVAAAKTYKAVMIGWAVVTATLEAIALGWAGVTVAEESTTGAMLVNKAAMIAQRGAALGVAAATKAWAAAQWIGNAAIRGAKWAWQTAAMLANKAAGVAVAAATKAWAAAQVIGNAALAAGSWLVQTAAMLAYKAAQLVVAGATKALAAAQWLLNAAMDANPVTLVVLAIAALVVGFILAYKHSAKFRAIVQGALKAVGEAAMWLFNWIKGHWKLLAAILFGPFGIAVLVISKHWSTIKNGATATWKWVTDKFNALIGFFRNIPNRISSAASGMWDGIKDAFKGMVNGIIDIWNRMPSFKIPSVTVFGKKLGGATIGLPHLNHLANGGITTGMTAAMLGDNPGGREAVVPLDKYDLPKKGESQAAAAAIAQGNNKMIDLLTQMLQHLAANSPEALADALAGTLGKHSDASLRRMVQIARTA